MKRTHTILLACIGAIAIILFAVLVIFIPSRTDQASDPTFTPTAPTASPIGIVAKTNTRAPTATTLPTATLTTPTRAPTIAPTNTATLIPTATLTPIPTLPIPLSPIVSQPTPTAPIGFTLRYLTPSTYVGGTAQATISTVPGASCQITVYDPRGKISEAVGLAPKNAGVDGMCTWIWVVSPSDFKGTGYVKIDANSMTQTFVYILQ
jgi:hypothetical protein